MKQTRAYLLGAVIGSVPDFVICWVAMRWTDSGWSGFWIAYGVLQAIYLFFWLKTALWSWLTFWVYRKKQLAGHLENWFIEHRYPVPDEYTVDLDDYYEQVSNNETADAQTRLGAAFERGTLNGLNVAGRHSVFLQMCSAGKVAMKRYAHLASRFAAGSMSPEERYQ